MICNLVGVSIIKIYNLIIIIEKEGSSLRCSLFHLFKMSHKLDGLSLFATLCCHTIPTDYKDISHL